MIKVLLVDDHDIVRMGIARMLADVPKIQVIGEVKTGEEALNFVRKIEPNVILMDVDMPGMGGIEATRKLKQRLPTAHILVLSASYEEPTLSRILGAGAVGYITKGACLEEMVRAIIQVAQGGNYFSSDVASQLAKNWANRDKGGELLFDALSRRERQMAELVAEGKSNQDIADIMGVALTTLSTYRSRIYAKLEIDNDVQLAHLAMRFGIIKKE